MSKSTEIAPGYVDVKKIGTNFAKQEEKQIFKILCR